MKSSPSPPPAPDLQGSAKAQGEANVDTARVQARLGNPNYITPYGTQTVDWGVPMGSQTQLGGNQFPNQPAPGPTSAPMSFAQWQRSDTSGNINDYQSYLNEQNAAPKWWGDAPAQPQQQQFNDQPTITQTLNPESQRIFDAQQAARMGLASLAQQGIGTAQGVLGTPFQFNGPQVQTSLGDQGQIQNAPDLFGFGSAQGNFVNPNVQSSIGGYGSPQSSIGGYGSPQGTLDTSGIANMPVNAGVTGQQAIMSRLQPYLEQQRNAEETRLRNQGLVAGGEAYGQSRTLLDQSQNDAMNQAALYGLNLDMSANQQGFGQALSRGQFGNQAQQQQYGQALGAGQFANQAQQQQYGQALGAGQFANQAAGQQFGQNLAAGQFSNQALAQNQQTALQQMQAQNAAQQQRYNQTLQSGQFANTAQQQALQQALYQRNLPLNEVAALMSGSQIQNPQFQGYQGANIAPPNIYGAAGQQAQYNQGLYNSQVGEANNMNSGLMSLAGAAAMAF